MQQQYRGDSCRDEQAHKDDRAPRYRVRHTRNMRPIKKAAIRETVRIVTVHDGEHRRAGRERQLPLWQKRPPFWVFC
jgi:hypothetical protein